MNEIRVYKESEEEQEIPCSSVVRNRPHCAGNESGELPTRAITALDAPGIELSPPSVMKLNVCGSATNLITKFTLRA